jgi:hypothetical protein
MKLETVAQTFASEQTLDSILTAVRALAVSHQPCVQGPSGKNRLIELGKTNSAVP